MKLFLLGKRASITHWLEDAVGAFRAEGHEVVVGVTRRPWLDAALEAALAPAIGGGIARAVRRFEPDLILAIGGFHVPAAILETVAALPGRAPLIGWVGDLFDEGERRAGGLFDVVGYTDSGLLARHQSLGFSARALFLPHAADPSAASAAASASRRPALVFIANPTDYRRAMVEAASVPIALFGRGWTAPPGSPHRLEARRVRPDQLHALYGSHLAALNLRNERNVLAGLNQRSFDPCLTATPVISDHQPDLELCFDVGREVLAFGEAAELDDAFERLRRDPALAVTIGEAGRARVLAEHGYGHRLRSLCAF